MWALLHLIPANILISEYQQATTTAKRSTALEDRTLAFSGLRMYDDSLGSVSKYESPEPAALHPAGQQVYALGGLAPCTNKLGSCQRESRKNKRPLSYSVQRNKALRPNPLRTQVLETIRSTEYSVPFPSQRGRPDFLRGDREPTNSCRAAQAQSRLLGSEKNRICFSAVVKSLHRLLFPGSVPGTRTVNLLWITGGIL